MRILFACDSMQPPLTGVGRASLTLLRELVALGHEVTPIDWRPNAAAAAVAGRCEILPLRGKRLPTARWHLDLARNITRHDLAHDVVIDPSGYPNAIGRLPRLVNVIHDLSSLQPGYYRRGKRLWFRVFLGRGLRRARLCVCVSAATRDSVLARYPDLPAERLLVIPNAFEPKLVEEDDQPLPAGVAAPFLLVVGTIEARKNIARTVAAFALARERGLRTQLVFAGRAGHGAQTLHEQIAAHRLTDTVRIVDTPNDATLHTLYRHARALVFCSLDEGFGLPILEAMQAGTPVMTSNVTAMPEVAGDAAVLVDPTDVDAIAEGMLQLAHDDALVDALVARGTARLESFRPRRIGAAWSNALEGLA